MDDIEIDPAKLLAIIKQEQPMVYELALRRAVIEQQRDIITALHGATATNGQAVTA